MLFGIGLLGEYVGRIYVQAQGRPRYLLRAVVRQKNEDGVAAAVDKDAIEKETT